MKKIDTLKATNPSDIPLNILISIIYRSSTVYTNHMIKNANITAAQIPFLLTLLNKKGLTQDEIANQCNIDKGAVARALKKLEDEELIIRKIDESNRRRNKVSLTEKGEEVAKKIEKVNNENEEEIYEIIKPYKKEELHSILKKIALISMKHVKKCYEDELELNKIKIKEE